MSGNRSSTQRARRLARLPSGVVPEVFAGLVPTPITEWNLILMWNVGPCSVPGPSNVIGVSWSRTSGCSGKNI